MSRGNHSYIYFNKAICPHNDKRHAQIKVAFTAMCIIILIFSMIRAIFVAEILNKLQKALQDFEGQRAAPVEKWNPPFCGDLDIVIKRNGDWHYMGSPIGRKPLVQLFSSVLRKEEDGKTYLVTPVEKVGIEVEDSHFLGVEMRVEGTGERQVLSLRTQTDEWIKLGLDHYLWFESQEKGDLIPYCHMRGRLTCRLNRSVYYQLMELGQVHIVDGSDWFGIFSQGVFFKMMLQDELDELSK